MTPQNLLLHFVCVSELSHLITGYQINFIYAHQDSIVVDIKDPFELKNTSCFPPTCDSSRNEECRNGNCLCRANLERSDDGNCEPCPREGESCGKDGCCFDKDLTCYYGICKRCYTKADECVSQEALVYMTLSQIALATAMIFGILALITFLYRILTHPMYMLSRSQTSSSNASAFNRGFFSRASLSSMQRAIIWRLRDRPPRYDATTSSNAAPLPSPTQSTANVGSFGPGEPPPLYEGVVDVEPIRDLPPTYAVAIISSPHLEAEESSSTLRTIAVLTMLSETVPPGRPKDETEEERKKTAQDVGDSLDISRSTQ